MQGVELRIPAGYELKETLHAGKVSWIARGRRLADGQPVILKGLRGDFPPPRALANIQHEHAVLQRAGASVTRSVAPLCLQGDAAHPVLVFPDHRGRAVSLRVAQGPLQILEALRIGREAALALAEVHALGIVHRDIKPANIVMDCGNPDVRLIDFGAASVLDRADFESLSPDRLVGTIAYIAPEQTGRLAQPVDARSDLYSLGATIYELVTGQLPFQLDDPLALIHAHLALVPADPCRLRPQLPSQVGDIIMKLLAKSPDDRYQSAHGLAMDLQACEDRIASGRRLDDLELGACDVPRRFALPTGFYGRTGEKQTLVEAFARAAAGTACLALVRGFSGSGKSALVNALLRTIYERGGLVATGKHDAIQRATPYAAIRAALGDLAGQLLSLPESALAARTRDLKAALGPNVGLAVEFVPQMAAVLGAVPAPEGQLDSTAEAARLRFQQTLLDLLRGAASPARPLVVFIDDLQWADPGTLSLLRLLHEDRDLQGLLVVGAWRDNEVDASHPLTVLVAQLMGDTSGRVVPIEVRGLDDAAMLDLVSATVHRPRGEAAALAQLVSHKTAGNPFFARLFLERLHHLQLLKFEQAIGWHWDVEQIRGAAITDNVAEMMATVIGDLSKDAYSVLGVAAALGSRVTLRSLANTLASGKDQPQEPDLAETWKALWPAVAAGLLVPQGAVLADVVPNPGLTLRFLHDRVQQSAYDGIAAEARAPLHARIVRCLQAVPADEKPTLFALADHAMLAAPALTDPQHRREFGALLVEAGRGARATAAYAAGLQFLQLGLQLAGDSLPNRVRFPALVDRYVCEFLTGVRDESAARFAELLQQAQGIVERAEVMNLRIGLLASQGQHAAALALAREALGALGLPVPASANLLAVIAEVTRLKLALGRRKPASIAELPEAQDARAIMVLRIINTIAASAYFSGTNLYTVYTLRMCRYTLTHGVTENAAFAWANYALVAGPILGDFTASAAFSRAARTLYERFGRIEVLPRLSLNLDGLVDPWIQHPAVSIALLEEGVRAGVHAGDPLYSAFCSNQITYLRLAAGSPLEALHRDSSTYEAFSRRHGIAESPETFVVTRHFAEALMVDGELRATLHPDAAEDGAWLSRLGAFELKIPIHIHRIVTALLHLLAGRHQQAAEVAKQAAAWTDNGVSTGYSSLQPLCLALGLLFQAADSPLGRRGRLRDAQKPLATLRKWARANPAGFGHRVALAEAEIARANQQHGDAAVLYERAIALAGQGNFAHEEGLACLRAASFFAAQGNDRVAGLYRRGALGAWQRWGATALVRQLQTAYPELHLDVTPGPSSTTVTSSIDSPTSSDTLGALDIGTVLRAAEALSREIRLDALIGRLLSLLVESAGAKRALLLLDRNGQLLVEGEIVAGFGSAQVLGGQPAQGRSDLAHSLVRYVQRTGQVAVAGDQVSIHSDPHLLSGKVRSAMAVPVASGGVLRGVVYVENDLIEGAFSGRRAALLEALSGQISVSIQNAELYRDQSEQTTAFRRFVPEEFLQILGHRDIRTVQLGDAVEREMAVLFADVRGFTAFSEEREPTEVFRFLNSYLFDVGPLVRRHGGFVDKYIGDAVMALFPGDPASAVHTAVEMQRAVANFNLRNAGSGLPALRVGGGVHSGRLALGVLGELERRETTVIGDAVNTAARLESLTKRLGADILVSDAVRSQLPSGMATRCLGSFAVAGRQRMVLVHEVLDHLPRAELEPLMAQAERLQTGLQARESRDRRLAAQVAEQTLADAPHDRVAAMLLQWATQPDQA